MIVVDTSAIIAVLLDEPDKGVVSGHLARAERILISAATAVETGIVAFGRRREGGLEEVEAIMRGLNMEVRAVDERQAALAVEAYRRFGRGMGHPARLNFGDCFSYALARSLDLPLLFKGDDFVHTDVRSAMTAA